MMMMIILASVCVCVYKLRLFFPKLGDVIYLLV